jgi:hypothetical protein
MLARYGGADDPAAGDDPIQVAQAPGGGPDNRPTMSEADRARMREQMIERVLDQAGLTDKEKAAAKNTMQAKAQAREILTQELDKLRAIANADNPSAQDLEDAMAAYRTVLTAYRKKIDTEDQALVAQLSLRAQARCLSLGILDNGLGGFGHFGGFGRPGGARMGGPQP